MKEGSSILQVIPSVFPPGFPKFPLLRKAWSNVAPMQAMHLVSSGWITTWGCGSGMVNLAHGCRSLSPEPLELVNLILPWLHPSFCPWVPSPKGLYPAPLNSAAYSISTNSPIVFPATYVHDCQSLWQGNFILSLKSTVCCFCWKKQRLNNH